jgi:hypothetical protein
VVVGPIVHYAGGCGTDLSGDGRREQNGQGSYCQSARDESKTMLPRLHNDTSWYGALPRPSDLVIWQAAANFTIRISEFFHEWVKLILTKERKRRTFSGTAGGLIAQLAGTVRCVTTGSGIHISLSVAG